MATVPYVAPWQVSFERFATILIKPTQASQFVIAQAVPKGRWWRPVWLAGLATTDAVVGLSRRCIYTVLASSGGTALQQPSTEGFPNNQFAHFNYSPLTKKLEATAGGGLHSISSNRVADSIWPEDTTLQLSLVGTDPGDAFAVDGSWLIEEYQPLEGYG